MMKDKSVNIHLNQLKNTLHDVSFVTVNPMQNYKRYTNTPFKWPDNILS